MNAITIELNKLPSLDRELSIKLAANNPVLATKLLKMLIKSLPKERQLIKQAFKAYDLANLRVYIHKLYGGCCYLGLPKLKYLAKNLDQALSLEQTLHIEEYVQLLLQEISCLLKIDLQRNFEVT